MWGLELLQQCENFFGTFVLQFAGHLPGGYGISFYHGCGPPTVSLRFLLCPWTWAMFFLVGSNILLSMGVQQLVVIWVHLQEEMSTSPSTLPSWLYELSGTAWARGVASAHPQGPNLPVTAAGTLKVNHHFTVCKISMTLTTLGTYIGEGNGTPLQYSCLENPMSGGAWKAAVHGVAEGRTRLSNFTFTFHFHAWEKEMATHSSVLAWRIPGTGKPGGLPSMGSHRVGHD